MDAFVSGRAGVAIIVDGDRLLSMSLEAHAPPTPCTTRDVRFLLGDARDLLIVEGKTMDEIRAHLMVARDHDYALQLTLFTLDAELSDDTREESALALEELLARDGVLELVEGEVERARMRAVFVRAGVFKALVDGDVDAAAVAVRVPAADEHEAMLQTWIRSLKGDSRVPRRFHYEPTHPAPTADLEQGRCSTGAAHKRRFTGSATREWER
jgi:hypothetical protein